MEAHSEENLEVKAIESNDKYYKYYNFKKELLTISSNIEHIADSFRKVKREADYNHKTRYTTIAYCSIISVVVSIFAIVLHLVMTSGSTYKLFVYLFLAVIHLYGLLVRKQAAAEDSLAELETKNLIRQAKDIATLLQTMHQSINNLPKDLFKAVDKVKIQAGCILKYEYIFTSERFVATLFPFYTAFIMCCLNIFVILAILMCENMMMIQCVGFFEQLEKIVSSTAYALIIDIVTLRNTLNQIGKDCLASITSFWIERLGELDGEIILLHENLDLFINLQPNL